jgi:hypothetical protein
VTPKVYCQARGASPIVGQSTESHEFFRPGTSATFIKETHADETLIEASEVEAHCRCMAADAEAIKS